MIITGKTFHPLILISSRSGLYLFILCCMHSSKNLSFVYVNSINCIVYLRSGLGGDGTWYDNPLTYSMSSLNWALQWHLDVWEVYVINQFAVVFSGGF